MTLWVLVDILLTTIDQSTLPGWYSLHQNLIKPRNLSCPQKEALTASSQLRMGNKRQRTMSTMCHF